jgi:hypothetical protein
VTEPIDGPIGWIREVVLDSPDPETLARFWAALVGGEPVAWYDGWWTLEPPPHGQRLSFQRSDGRPPEGGGGGVHVDVLVADLEAAHRRVLALGAEYVTERWSPRPDDLGRPVPWRVYRDPVGHPFCLVVR